MRTGLSTYSALGALLAAALVDAGCHCNDMMETESDGSSTSTSTSTGGETSTSTTDGTSTSTTGDTTTTSTGTTTDPSSTTLPETGEVDPCADFGELCFVLGPTVLGGVQVGALATIEVGGDEFPDLVAATAGGLVLLDNAGLGELSMVTTVGAGYAWVDVAVGDIDGDGDPDVVGVGVDKMQMMAPTMLLVVTNEDGVLGEPTAVPMSDGASSLALADLSGDGDLDVIAVAEEAGLLALLLGDGGGAFTPSLTLPCGTAPVDLVVTPIDGDAAADVAVANFGASSLGVSLVSGGVPGEVKSFALGGAPRALVAGSLAKGARHLISVGEGDDLLEVLVADDVGDLAAVGAYPLADIPGALALGDFNGGGTDVAVALRGLAAIGFYLGDGDGNLAPYTTFNVLADPSALAVGHFNGDNRPDLAVASEGVEGGVRLLLSMTEAP
ncbi:MAG: VCBS repeat-containing protein [Myxococcales bacterium]|nr:VCBS repeat-containing protein [Myxococcales bacterium]